MEALLCIIIEVFTYRKDRSPEKPAIQRKTSQDIAALEDIDDDDNEGGTDDVDVDENWSGTIWQYTVLAPFADQLKS